MRWQGGQDGRVKAGRNWWQDFELDLVMELSDWLA